MAIHFDKREAVYIQVIRYFKEQIAIGELKSGQEIPSRRELAQQLKINPNTVQRAYKEMEEEGLIYTDGNKPSIVTEEKKRIKEIRESLITEAIDQFVDRITSLQIPKEQVFELVQSKLNEPGREGEEKHD
ncbi:GntR family transcriptional regulator [Oceanobacillus neutriphilus]|uniref:GntR family transcriptional regulator n=1 Tax=Oceanobacillus neutriphilus TaxID=531815 RepID=A0ABQ2P0B8_9BACI|nr:GntR family transcriptional regulator [Oceanobacillus neutriphilus]GGP15028.1 GntR family transcriptional regulator [Oceanobacillus neutriphilus]